MTNIWEFLIATITASLVAILLLALKRLLSLNLSPRWQYGIWSLLALRIILPAAVSGHYILLPVPVWIETLKYNIEKNLSSAYSAAFEPVNAPWFLPSVSNAPVSITDWLFIIYICGIILFIARCILSYIRMCFMLRKSVSAGSDVHALIAQVCSRYDLKACRIAEAGGITSAFVCGFVRPVLVLPAETVTDEKVILHELLHLKYKDALQSAFWNLLRAFHWCNPFMHYVFNQISNDMEALCDQRVLELLEGEDRRDYGTILLSMANDKYPRAFGTTSISNGGKNIARRIECIVHFKKYPRGMALVSICIGILLVQPLLIGTPVYGLQTFEVSASHNDEQNLYSNMATMRLNRCTTMAGAIDTYAKGLIAENGLYLAAASPLDKQEELIDAMIASRNDGWIYTHLENGINGQPSRNYNELSTPLNNGYSVFNLKRVSENSSTHTGQLVIYLDYYQRTEEEIASGMPVFYEDPETGGWLPAAVIFDITTDIEGSNWVVKDCRKSRVIIPENINYASNLLVYEELTPTAVYKGSGKHGNIAAPLYAEYHISQTENNQQNNLGLWNDSSFDTTPLPGAEFETVDLSFLVTYNYGGGSEKAADYFYVTLENLICDEESDIPEKDHVFNKHSSPHLGGSSVGSSSDGWAYISEQYGTDSSSWNGNSAFWGGTITDRNTNQYFTYKKELKDYFKNDTMPELPRPAAIASKVYMSGIGSAEDFIISREVTE